MNATQMNPAQAAAEAAERLAAFRGLGDAEDNGGGNWLKPGMHLLQVKSVVMKKSTNPKKKGVWQFIVELMVVETNAPDTHTPGTSCSWVVSMNQQPAMNNIKGFVRAVAPAFSITKEQLDALPSGDWEKLAMQLTDPSNPLGTAGVKLRAEAFTIKTTKNEDFTKVNWSPA